MLKDRTRPEEFRSSDAWDSPLLDFRLWIPKGQGENKYFKSNSLSGNERNRLIMRDGEGFVERTLVSGADCKEDARGFALMDFDRDGWVDILLPSCNGPRLRLFRNRLGELGATGRVVEVVLRGGSASDEATTEASNRDAVGAVLTAVTDRRTTAYRRSIGEGNASQNSARLRVTLAEGEQLESLSVRWPSGKVTELSPVPAGRLVEIAE